MKDDEEKVVPLRGRPPDEYLRQIDAKLAFLERQFDRVFEALHEIVDKLDGAALTGADEVAALGRGPNRLVQLRLTTKQHAALQMLMNGASNQQIADRCGVTANSAKVYVRGIAHKLGVSGRGRIITDLYDDFQAIDETTYRALSHGLPKDWHLNYREPDPYAPLYRRSDEDEVDGDQTAPDKPAPRKAGRPRERPATAD